MATRAKPKKDGKHGSSAARAEIPKFDPDDVVIVGLDTKDGPEHPLCDAESNETPLNEATVRFTMRHGVIQPPVGRRDGARVLIVAGRGRTRHLREANKRLKAEGQEPWLLPILIRRGDDVEMVQIRLGENSHRRKLDPFIRAHEANLLIKKGNSKQDVADNVGVTVHQLTVEILPLLDLTTKGIKAIRSGVMSPTAAAKLAKLSQAEQDTTIDELMAGGAKPTVRDAKNKVRESQGKAPLETARDKLARIADIIDEQKIVRAGNQLDLVLEVIERIRAIVRPVTTQTTETA